MKTKIITSIAIVFVCAAAAFLYAQLNGHSLPGVEVNARFADADTNGDGILSKEEFAKYLASQKPPKAASQDVVRICPKTGAPCTGDGMCSSGDGEACGGCDAGGGGCCGGMNQGAKTVPVKAPLVKEVAGQKEGGCCGGKDKAGQKEGGCCGGKDKTGQKEDQEAAKNQ